MLAVSESLPHALLASHLYSPASLLLIFVNTNSLTLKRSPLLTLTQDTIGGDTPGALQCRVTLLPSVTVLFCTASMDEGTAGKKRQQRIKNRF